MQHEERRMKTLEGDAALRTARFTFYGSRTRRGFTLIELLIVIAIIATLAALTFPAVRAAKIAVLRARVKAEMTVIQSGIELYHDKFGYYPPDNYRATDPEHYARNQLYYELMGTTNIGKPDSPIYVTLDVSSKIAASSFNAVFGPNVTGFMNCVRGGSEEAPNAQQFLKSLRPNQHLVTTFVGMPCEVLGAGLDGPTTFPGPNGTKINPWRYNSSNPRYNPKTFDLWMDVAAGSKTNRICNWSDKPLVVSTPY